MCLFIGLSIHGYSQEFIENTSIIQTDFKTKNKGKLYFYWGWNKSQYSYSDITFKGDDYNFTLYNVAAKDRQNPWEADLYLNPSNIFFMTIGIFLWDLIT